MKKILTAVLALAMTATVSTVCATTASAATSTSIDTTSAAYTSGATAGKAINALYTQYKADGKLDLKNTTNLVEIGLLGASIVGLKDQTKDSDFYKSFSEGIVLGSAGLISDENSSTVTDALSSISSLDFSTVSSSSSSSSSSSVLSKVKNLFSKSSSSSSDDESSDSSDSSTISTTLSDLFSKLGSGSSEE